jgi:tRNA(adenine34) deaminase
MLGPFISLLCLALSLHILFINRVQSWTLKSFRKKWSRKNIVYLDDCGDPFVVHNHFMTLAMEEAKISGDLGEVPIGAVIIQRRSDHEYEILSRAGNRVEINHDASAHAELQALRRASAVLQNWRLVNTTLYSTLEPCPMCLAACQAFRIPKLVYGAPDLRLGAVETHMRLLDITHPFHNISDVIKEVQAEPSASLLRSFFKRRRHEGKTRSNSELRPKRNWLLRQL